MKYFFLPVFILVFFSACGLKDTRTLKYDLKIDAKNKSIIKGKITKSPKSSKDINIVLFKHIKGDVSEHSSYRYVDLKVFNESKKEYQFEVTDGLYFIYACQNLEVLREEKYAYEFISDYVYIDSNTTKSMDIELAVDPTKASDDNILVATTKEKELIEEIRKIKTTTLEDAVFDRSNALKGVWEPYQFYKDVGGGIYFLEEFTPKKKVILFVHGMGGTPTDFQYIIKQLDKTQYIPMVYYYPSGINLNFAADGLVYYFDILKKQYKIDSVVIIAHSVGGLVSRAFLNRYQGGIEISKFISIATPWNGQKFAQLGGDMAGRLVASFGNMVPHSAFLENIQIKELPDDLQHYLFFAYKGKNSLILENSNDGIISLSSQLYKKAQDRAYSLKGFNENHTSILQSKDVVSSIEDILEN